LGPGSDFRLRRAEIVKAIGSRARECSVVPGVIGRKTGAIAYAFPVAAAILIRGSRLMMAFVLVMRGGFAGGVRRTRTVEAADGEQRDEQVRKRFPVAQHA
jgi:hypothetical protein